MILRLRQLCCHPNLILVSVNLLNDFTLDIDARAQSLTDGYEDPTLLVASGAEKELGRARKLMGAAWVAEVGPMLCFENIGLTHHTQVKKRFLLRAAVSELLDFSDEADAPEANCPVCKDSG